MTLQTAIRFEPYDIDQRLAELGLDRQTFVRAAEEGWAAFAACTPNHPATFPGTAAWAETVRSIRDSLTATGWTRKTEANLPLVLNSLQTIAITASAGDEETGQKEGFPRTRSAKGPRTAAAVRINLRQLELFEFMYEPGPVLESIKTPGRATWLFLVYRDLRSNELRYELSQPISMAEDGCVDTWSERIIFPPASIDPRPRVSTNRSDDGQSPEITVEIKKLA